MELFTEDIELHTRGRGCFEITAAISECLRASHIDEGLCSIHIQHTSASLLITENADADVLGDLERFLARLAPDGDPIYQHTAEGADDMPAHIRSALTQTSLSIPVRNARLALGTWQGVFVYEHRRRAHTRRFTLTLIGESATNPAHPRPKREREPPIVVRPRR